MTTPASNKKPRCRVREAVPGIHLGFWPPGPKNSLTDVPGVLVHTETIRSADGQVNTGATTILPRKDWFRDACHAGVFRFNGAGEMTGCHWLAETGLLASPIVITNSFSVGDAYRGVLDYAVEHNRAHGTKWFMLPVVAETFDGFMNDLYRFAVTPEHIAQSIRSASSAPVPEGNVGGGTGMLCQGFKGGTGSSSRLVPGVKLSAAAGDGKTKETSWTVAALVQANYGQLHHLHFAGVPVGRIMAEQRRADEATAAADRAYAEAKDDKDGSIIVVVATDAPLNPLQCQRLARRATAGLARVGGYGHNLSGDIFLAFSTGSSVVVQTEGGQPAQEIAGSSIDDNTINALFEAAADATQEAIYNALCMAETMTGFEGHTVEAIDLDKLREVMDKHMVR
ncbi:hypothetical protein PoMZ_06657 [Pyricularia oryzae]|uniref:Peptidase family T4 n=1 Tax=Pyricularia oryzae TaxID=318829 RepID=A0A4P7NSV7_PYROR|nr:hypothetical protein PoMZ_06657 [Pyricularia oryzae]